MQLLSPSHFNCMNATMARRAARARGIAALGLLASLTGGAAAQSGIFDLSHSSPASTSAIVTRQADTPTSAEIAALPPMTRELGGVLGVLGSKELVELRRCVGPILTPAPGAAGPEPTETYAFVQLNGSDLKGVNPEHRVVRIGRLPDGTFFVEDTSPKPAPAPGQPPRRWTLRPEFFAPIAGTWSSWRTDPAGLGPGAKPASPPARVGAVFELEKPYTPGLFTMTPKVLGDRLLAGGVTSLRGTTRDLAAATFHCRLPKGFKPGIACGVIVWCDASPSGKPPPTFDGACDELGLIVAGAANVGNEIPSVERYQAAMDVLATVRARYVIDPARVYISGISGGARICSTLAGCFPDVFMGEAPIVGLACFENVPNGLGQFWPGAFRKPVPKLLDLLKARRIAPITGEKDFNYPEITGAAKIYEAAKFQIHVYSTPDMGHQMPTPERLTEALKWIDEPYRDVREKAIGDAERAMAAFKGSHSGGASDGSKSAFSDADRATLAGVIKDAPWSAPAWEAAGLLGAAKR